MSIQLSQRVIRVLRNGAMATAAAACCVAVLTLDVAPFGVPTASAIVGRPRTPRSVAGVARRTVRNTVGPAPIARANYIAALPAGCVFTANVYVCGGVRYRPYYQGPNLVYVRL